MNSHRRRLSSTAPVPGGRRRTARSPGCRRCSGRRRRARRAGTRPRPPPEAVLAGPGPRFARALLVRHPPRRPLSPDRSEAGSAAASSAHQRHEADALEQVSVTPSSVRRATTRRCSPSSTGATSRPPGAGCSASAGGIDPPAAAATLIASYGAWSGRPREPSPTTSVTFSTPPRAGCGRPAARATHAPRSSTRDAPAAPGRGDIQGGPTSRTVSSPVGSSSSHMRATTSGCEIVWPGRSAAGCSPRLRAQVRRHEAIARHLRDRGQHALVGDVPAQRVHQPLGRRHR